MFFTNLGKSAAISMLITSEYKKILLLFKVFLNYFSLLIMGLLHAFACTRLCQYRRLKLFMGDSKSIISITVYKYAFSFIEYFYGINPINIFIPNCVCKECRQIFYFRCLIRHLDFGARGYPDIRD